MLHFAGALVGALAAAWLIWRIDGAPSWRAMLPLGTTAREGTRYALGTTVGIGYQEIDKVLLLQVLGATVTGTYTAAFRVISVLVLPLYALMSAALPRLFAIHGSPEGRRMLKAITMAAVAYGLAAPMVAILIAPFMPKIFGQGFSDSTTYLLMLAPWVLPFALHQVAALGLTASGWQFPRVIVEATGLGVVIALNVLLLPGVGPSGAIVALLVAETLMAVACWLLLRRLQRVT
jgi:O-antigen/teichoic acid export membrane protein